MRGKTTRKIGLNINEPCKIIIGLMSGTSADGIDAALVRIFGAGLCTKIELVAYDTYPHSRAVRDKILQLAAGSSVMVEEVCGLNVILAQEFAKAAIAVCDKAGLNMAEVDLIGSHGQTIRHLPERYRILDREVTATWQIGDPSIIAKVTGVTTIGDFRVADMAVGGQGAPLVPFLDFLLLRSDQEVRLCLNIGGISNLTYMPIGASPADVLAFDAGPGNMLIDAAMQCYYQKPYDKDGQLAASGQVDHTLIRAWLREPFYQKPPPKSTGRELFNLCYLDQLRGSADRRGLQQVDFIATLTALTAEVVFLNYEKFLQKRGPIHRLIVSGGGCRNPQIMRWLEYRFADALVTCIDAVGWPSEAKEAVCFAVLANETSSGNPANLPSVTGAHRSTILGKICPGG
jgi:anhydro-N-acetylmuramic acid kinase